MNTQQAEVVQTALVYLTVNQLCENHKAFKTGGIRALIFNEDKNGLAKSGAIVRMGRKVLINQQRFFEWLESGQSNGAV